MANTHFAVALAFVGGLPSKNARMKTDGQSIVADGSVIATKTDDGLVILATYRTRSGSIMRSAVQRAAFMAKRYAQVKAPNGHFPATRDELLALWKKDCDDRASLGLEPFTFAGRGQL
jgi:hypothetical protein